MPTIVAISDTHTKHWGMEIPEGDILIHAGDFSNRGSLAEAQDFLHWYGSLPHPRKILVAGNHDFAAEKEERAFLYGIPAVVTYLNEFGVYLPEHDLNIWGSPVQPEFCNWAFNRRRGPEIVEHWARIPEDTDILVTHGPPHGILDMTRQYVQAGCEDLLEAVRRVKPKVHIFGHIHEGYGMREIDGTVFVNASQLDERYCHTNKPVVFEL